METQISLSFMLVMLMGSLICSSQAYKFFVGGKDGWVLNPSENYNHWAERNRFQVNDTLFFKYKKGSDSVLVVTKEDYYKCNTKNPIHSLTDGDSIFKFNQSGPFFFISGNNGSCQKGTQKLIIVVMAVRNKTHQPPLPPITGPPTSSPPVSPTAAPSDNTPAVSSPPQKAESPEAGDNSSDLNAPAPVPETSSSPAFSFSVTLVWGFSIGASVFLGSFV